MSKKYDGFLTDEEVEHETECGKIFEEPDSWEECRGEYWGVPCTETMYGCPKCGGSYEEAYECKECGDWHFREDLDDGLCESCREEKEG